MKLSSSTFLNMAPLKNWSCNPVPWLEENGINLSLVRHQTWSQSKKAISEFCQFPIQSKTYFLTLDTYRRDFPPQLQVILPTF